jgi:hypothetical protein
MTNRHSSAYVGPRTSTPAHFAGGGVSLHTTLNLAPGDVADDNRPAKDADATGLLFWSFDDSDDVRSRHPEHIDVISQVYSSLK